jgi:hypothetical protein
MQGQLPLPVISALVLGLLSAGLPVEELSAQEPVQLGRPIPGPVIPPPYFRAALEAGTLSPDGIPEPN